MTQTLDPASTKYGDLIARSVRICNAALVMDRNGHVSQRDESDPNVFWINNRHASRSTLTAADIVPFDIRAGRRVGEGIEPPSEWHIHREIYRRRPDVKGIVHSHPQFIFTLSAVGQKLKPLFGATSFIPEDGAPVFDSPVLIDTEVRGKGMADAMGDALMVVLRQHGTVMVGRSAEEAVVRMINAEDNARLQYQALQIGTPTYLRGEELKLLLEEGGSPHGVRKSWHYWEETTHKWVRSTDLPDLRIAIVGMGAAARRMLPAIDKAPGIRLAAICDPLPEVRDPIAKSYGIPGTADLAALLKLDGIDAVYIATPTDMHAEHVIASVNAGKHVLCEKPMATTMEDAQAMIDAADRAGVVYNVGHSHSYDEPNRAMRALIASGEFGRVRLMHNIHYTDWVYRPRLPEELDANRGGGATFRQGAHQFDILRLLGGGLVKSVRGQTFDWDPQRPVIGAHSVMLTFEDGTVASAIYNGYGAFLSSEMTYGAGAVGYAPSVGPGSSRAEMKSATAASEAKQKRTRAMKPAEDELPPTQPFFGWTIVSCEGGDIRQSPTGLYVYTERGCEERPLRMDLTTRDPVIEEFVETVAGRRRALHDGHWARANLEVCVATMKSGRTGQEIQLQHQVAVPPGT